VVVVLEQPAAATTSAVAKATNRTGTWDTEDPLFGVRNLFMRNSNHLKAMPAGTYRGLTGLTAYGSFRLQNFASRGKDPSISPL
jgi:hypothetical protein